MNTWSFAYRDDQDVEGVARCVPLDEIEENDSNLNIPRYIEPVIKEKTIAVAEAFANLKASLNAVWEAEDKPQVLLQENGFMERCLILGSTTLVVASRL